VDGRVVWIVAATLALTCLVFVALGLFTPPYGVLIAGAIAVIVGVGAGILAEPARVGPVTAVVVGYVAILIVAYLTIGRTAARRGSTQENMSPSSARGSDLGINPADNSSRVGHSNQSRDRSESNRDRCDQHHRVRRYCAHRSIVIGCLPFSDAQYICRPH
jgi:type IV secretory pathway TrbL component